MPALHARSPTLQGIRYCRRLGLMTVRSGNFLDQSSLPIILNRQTVKPSNSQPSTLTSPLRPSSHRQLHFVQIDTSTW
ncbi:hypothetical protein XA68_14255 [Ophiocordyceps unilateralis]|uniref:Uncharacterized protein n=1 Tax=Ophiocordyceps unilateralis TaxID=268505 RepID=A0A2A9PAK2_OPHUN|nr:hypothetical protein XA68_14255 [Ophiocordyceps unilateralis]